MSFSLSTIRSRLQVLLLLAAAVPFIAGCGGADPTVKKTSGRVEGTLTFNGQPVKAGTVSFEKQGGGDGASAVLDAAGKFAVADPIPVGPYVAFVLPVMLTPDEMADGKTAPAADDIPEKYRSMESSDLKIEVKEGRNTFELEMKP